MYEIKLDSIENIIQTLESLAESLITSTDVKEKQNLVWDFNRVIFNSEDDIINDEVDTILVHLADDIEYYVANENHRKECREYFGEEKLIQYIEETANKLRSIK